MPRESVNRPHWTVRQPARAPPGSLAAVWRRTRVSFLLHLGVDTCGMSCARSHSRTLSCYLQPVALRFAVFQPGLY